MSVLHTWGQNVLHHPHAHCVIPAGGLSLDHQHWIHPRYAFFLPVKVLSRVFRGKFTAGLKKAFRRRQLTFPGSLQPLAQETAFRSFLRSLFRQDWVVYAKPPFGGPQHVLHYLARYTHRVAISNHRIVALRRWPRDVPLEGLRPPQQTETDDCNSRGVPAPLPSPCASAWLCAHPLLRLLKPIDGVSPCCRSADNCCRWFLRAMSDSIQPKACSRAVWQCPHCGGSMLLMQRFTAAELKSQSAQWRIHIDSS